MDAAIAETAIKAYLKEIHTRLNEAAGIAKAADACAEAGDADSGVQVALDIEQLCLRGDPPARCREPDQPPRQGGIAHPPLRPSPFAPASASRLRGLAVVQRSCCATERQVRCPVRQETNVSQSPRNRAAKKSGPSSSKDSPAPACRFQASPRHRDAAGAERRPPSRRS